jgi:hypothetical protein
MSSARAAELSLRRDLLIARASAERIALREQLDRIDFRTRGVQGIAQLAAGGLGWGPASKPLSAAKSALRFLRSRPWLVSVGVALGARLIRSRTLRWIAAAAVVGAGIWLVRRAVTSADTAADPSG